MSQKRTTQTADHEKAQPVEVKPPEAKPEQENLLEKAKLISDLAAAWQNSALAEMMKSLPSGDRIFKIFSEAINAEMSAVMTGNAKESAIKTDSLAKQMDQMGASMANFHQLIMGFINSPLVQVLDLMNKNLGARGHQFVQPQAPQAQQVAPEYNSDPTPARGARTTGLSSF